MSNEQANKMVEMVKEVTGSKREAVKMVAEMATRWGWGKDDCDEMARAIRETEW
jgi:hypothetical protein